MMENAGVDSNSIVSSYQSLIMSVQREIQAAYNSGLKDTDDYVQELQNKYWSYAKSMQEAIINNHEKIISEFNNQITLIDNWLTNANRAGNHDRAKKYTEDIVKLYKEMQDELHREAEYYRSMGYSDTSDEVSKLSDLWWDYRDNIIDAMVSAYEGVINTYKNSITLNENWLNNAINNNDRGAVARYTANIVDYYRKMQQEIHEEAEYYRSMGYSDTSDEVSKLSDLWWDYRDNIIDAMVSAYEGVINTYKNSITLNENWLNNAINNNDRGAVARYTANIVDYYRKMQQEIHEEAEYYRSMGYSDTSDEVSKLSDLWWDYQEKIKEALMAGYDALLDNANDAVDTIQKVYDTFKDAAQEYAESGFITVDTLQSICELGVQYLAYLQDENGQLVINEENIQRVIAARTEQLAIEQALNYVEQLRIALAEQDTATLNNLLYATQAATNSTWDLVYAQLNLLNLNGQQYQAAVNNLNALRSLTESVVSSIGQTTGALKEANEAAQKALEEQQDALDDILKYVKEMIKQEVKNQVDALKKQKSAYKDIVDLQKKSLELEKQKNNYNRTVAEKLSEMGKLQQRIQMLDLDSSREAQNEKMKLQEELYKLQTDLADEQNDYAYDATVDALDDMYDAYADEKDKEIETLENTISSEEKLYQLSIERISTQWDSLYEQLIAYNTEYGTHLNEEITTAWGNASIAVQQYGSYLQAVAGIQAELNALQEAAANMSSSTVVSESKTYDTSGENYIRQMKANSAAWHDASEAGRKRLADENVELAKKVEEVTGLKLVRGNDGVWYVNQVGGAKLYEMYHTGTSSAGQDPTPKQDEIFAKIQKGEMILNQDQQEKVYRSVDAAETMLGKYGAIVGALSNPDTISSLIQKQLNENSPGVNMTNANYSNPEINVPVQIYTVQKLDEAELNKLVKTIGNRTTDMIREGFTKNGVRNIPYRT